MGAPARSTGLLGALAAFAAAVSPPAAADDVSAQATGDYASTTRRSTDAAGVTAAAEGSTLGQRYRLSFDRSVYPNLRVGAGGSLDYGLAWPERLSGGGADESRASLLFASLTLSQDVVSAGAGYERRATGDAFGEVPVVTEGTSAYGRWRPDGLPALGLRLSRVDVHDDARARQDTTRTDVRLDAQYSVGRLDARYAVSYGRLDDARSGYESAQLKHAVDASYGATVGRTLLYASYSGTQTASENNARAAGVDVVEPRFAAAGLSLVEAFPYDATTATLDPNPALVDGDTAAGASVDLGHAAATGTDRPPREIGVAIADRTIRVNRLRIWVDRRLPPEVAGAIGWTVYRSDDNQRWTPLLITAPAAFDAVFNRFELGVEASSGPYLKAVAAPLAPAVTTDPRYATIAVTELQILELLPGSSLAPRQTALTNTLNATARTLLLRRPGLTHDLALSLAHRTDPRIVAWSVSNGLSASGAPHPKVTVSGRLARQDSGTDGVREGTVQYSASAAYRPLETVTQSVVYSGQVADAGPGVTWTNGVSLLARADVYEGLALLANGGYAVTSAPGARTTRTTVNAAASATPNRRLSASAAWTWARGTSSQPGARAADAGRISASVSSTPVPTLFVTLNVARITHGPRPTTLLGAIANYAPILNGDLQLSAAYTESFDSEAESRSRLASGGVTWFIRRGASLTASYTAIRTSTPVAETTAGNATATLNVSFL